MADDDVIRFGRNVTPNRVIVQTRDDGKTDVFYSKKGDAAKGHTVQNEDGTLEYARTMGGNVLVNKNPK
jgi:hypothetical protein